RVDSSRHRGRGGGSGLGLSIVQAVVTAHGGQVGVRTTPGGGASFRVGLPAAPSD
ncbi:MAG: ATP-binding protein, partial [Kineosporiaceae bacterium]